MDDGEFWDYVLNGVDPGATSQEEDALENLWFDDEDVQRAPCPECGATGACGYDDQGRALIHASFDPEERPAWAQNDLDGRDMTIEKSTTKGTNPT